MDSTETTDFGAMLRLARERRSLTLQAVSEATKISPGVLTALESNDIEHLPGGLFIRSFVRAYAAEVGLDPEETVNALLDAFPDLRPDRLVQTREKTREDLSAAERAATEPGVARTAIRLVVLSAIVVAVLIFFGLRGSDAPSEADEPDNPTSGDLSDASSPSSARELDASNASNASSTLNAPTDTRSGGASATGEETLDVTDTTALGLSPAEAGRPRGNTRAASPPVSAAPAPGRGPAASGPLTIAVHPTAACWVSLTIDGQQVFAGVLGSGEQEVYQAENQIILNVGDAGLFEFSINQQPGRSLGESGQVVTVEIDRDNYQRFLSAHD